MNHYPQAILWDFDGVLADSVSIKTDAFAALFDPFGPTIRNQVTHYHETHGGISRFEKIRYYFKEYLKQEVNEEKVQEWAKRFSELVVEKVVASAWIPGAKEVLEKYSKQIPMYLISGTPQEELKQIVQRRRMTDYFNEVLGSPIKKKEHFQSILQKNRYAPEDLVYIGDSQTDCQTALETRIPFIGIGNSEVFPTAKAVFKNCRPLINYWSL